MEFRRTKRPREAEYNSSPTCFKLSENAIKKFNAKNQGNGWNWETQLEKVLNYKLHEVTFRRSKNDDTGKLTFQAFVPIYGGGEFLKLGLRLNDRGGAFFVYFLEIVRQVPSPSSSVLITELNISFKEVWDTIDQAHHFGDLWQDLQELRELKYVNRRDVDEEIATWSKYLAAAEKITIKKTVILPVKKGRKNARGNGDRGRGKEWIFEYELDTSRYAEMLTGPLREIMAPYQVVDLNVDEYGGHVDLKGRIADEADFLNSVREIAAVHYYRVDLPSAGLSHFLRFGFEFRHRTAAAKAEMLEQIVLDMHQAEQVVKREGAVFSVSDWHALEVLRKQVKAHSEVMVIKGQAEVRFDIQHRLDDAEVQQGLCRDAGAGMYGSTQGLEISVLPKAGLRVHGLNKQNLEGLPVLKAFSLVTVTASVALIGDPKLAKLPKGMVLKEEKVGLKAMSLGTLRGQWQALQKANEGGTFADWEAVEIHWEFKLTHLLEQAHLQDRITKSIRKLRGAKFNWPKGQVELESEAAFLNWQRDIAALDADLRMELSEIKLELTFQVDDHGIRKNGLQKLHNNLQEALGKNLVEVVKDDQSWELSGVIRLSDEEALTNVNTMLSGAGDGILVHESVDSEGFTRLGLLWDEQGYETFLDARWKDLRNCTIKFLTSDQYLAYLDELKGEKGDSFRGGEELGRLRGLRNGKARILLEDSEIGIGEMKAGFLLPVFNGDLTQQRRLREAMSRVQYPRGGLPMHPNLRNFIFDPSMAEPIQRETNVSSDQYWQLRHALNEAALNERQREAVSKAIAAEDMVLIQGPPGTGKTTVIAEIIWQMLQEDPDCRILISSQAHLAVDNVLQRLYKKNLIRPLRVASSKYAKRSVEPEGQKYVQEIIDDWAKAAPDSKEEKEAGDNAISAWMGRTIGHVEEDPKFEALQKKWKAMLAAPKPDAKRFFARIYLNNVNVVAATCLECGKREFKKDFSKGFDAVIVDEASKATPPELLLPLILGRKVIIIGDHKQLPPMIDERQIEEVLEEMGETELAADLENLKVSQFEKLFLGADDSICVTLNTQYRMHENIMRVIDTFYKDEGGLECGIKASMDNADMNDRGSRWHGINVDSLISPDTHVVWLDVKGPETNHQPSFSNAGEVEVIRKLLGKLEADEGFQAFQAHWKTKEEKEIGMISFYGKQVEQLKEVVSNFSGRIPIRLRTVDKFQGMERNIMIVSTVRSDTQVSESKAPKNIPRLNRSIGFAQDYRRINVAFSRARHLLIIVGNEAHFSKALDIYQNIKQVVARHGARIDESQLK